MSTGKRYPDAEIVHRAEAIYAKIKHLVDPGNDGKILAIDIVTGEYEVNAKELDAVERLFNRVSNPQVFCYRIGYETVHSFVGSPKRIAS